MNSTQKKILIGVLIFTVLIVVAGWLLVPWDEPTYKNRPLSYWVECADGYQPNPEYPEAISEIGTSAIPFLLKYMEYRPPGWWKSEETLPRWARGVKRVSNHVKTREHRAQGAQKAFRILGPAGAGAIPELNRIIPTLRTNDETYALFALANIGEKALPSLCAWLTNRQLAVTHRATIAMNLSFLGEKARPAVPMLIECLQDSNEDMMMGAMAGLGELKLEAERVVPILVTKLSHPHAKVRQQAAMGLEAFGPEAGAAAPTLLKTIQDDNVPVAMRAVYALWAIDKSLGGEVQKAIEERKKTRGEDVLAPTKDAPLPKANSP